MAADPFRQHLTVAEYLELDRNSPEAKYEYIDGVAYNLRATQAQGLAGGSLVHARVALNLAIVLDQLLASSSCQVFTSDVRVQLSASRYVYPDVTVTCEPTDNWQDDTIYAPRLVIEVLSPSTEAYDRGQKFAYYQPLASLQEYVLVTTQEQVIEVYTRDGNAWQYRRYTAPQEVTFSSIGIAFPLAAAAYQHVNVSTGA